MTDHDPLRDLWATDQGEKFTMSLADLTQRSDRFRSRIHRRNLIEYLAAILVVGVFGWIAYLVPVWSIKIGAGMIALAAVYIGWQLNRIASTSTKQIPGETLVNSHRRELARQRDALNSVWQWYLLPFVPGILVFTLGTTLETAANVPLWVTVTSSATSLGFIGLIFFGIWALNRYAAKQLGKQIDALESVSIDDENR